jgi:hypothetical protein
LIWVLLFSPEKSSSYESAMGAVRMETPP